MTDDRFEIELCKAAAELAQQLRRDAEAVAAGARMGGSARGRWRHYVRRLAELRRVAPGPWVRPSWPSIASVPFADGEAARSLRRSVEGDP